MTNFTRAYNVYVEYEVCPAANDLEVYGDYYSTNSKYIVIKFMKCIGVASCKTSSEIKTWSADKAFRFTSLNSYFDGKSAIGKLCRGFWLANLYFMACYLPLKVY